ncbi:MAG: hypothetical protein JWP74_616 [Marmoricola sp.]|nr:hypothetical protein [Marmoricola sp.]
MYGPQKRSEAAHLLATGVSLSDVSRSLGIGRSTIRDWSSSAPVRGCPAPHAPTRAYAALLGFYLGDGCISRNGRAYSLRISCDAKFPGIIADVEACIEAVHPDRRTYRVSAPGCVVVQSYWQYWPCLFPQHGPGRKHERTLVMEPWQQAIVDDYPAAFLRGLFHSDGCRVNNGTTRPVQGVLKRYEYPRWQFTNESADIMKWCGQALDRTDVAWRQTNRRTLSVSTRAGVARLDELIGVKP